MIRFFVPGVPAPGGSKTPMRNPHTGKIYVKDACKRNPAWRDRVASFALEAMAGRRPMEGPIRMTLYFMLPRPKSHYGTGKNADKLKDTAPIYHTSKPDATKLVRSTEDALTGILWRDDAVIAQQVVDKTYEAGKGPGVIVEVMRLEP